MPSMLASCCEKSGYLVEAAVLLIEELEAPHDKGARTAHGPVCEILACTSSTSLRHVLPCLTPGEVAT
jgi:hypothetical protein